jgi:catechol 2,3-dioxygenase-like lactoylglutathione lyase family enzyme
MVDMDIKSISSLSYKVDDINKTKEFYEALGFRFASTDPEGMLTAYINWFSVRFYQDVTEGTKGVGQATHLKVGSADDCYEALLAKGMKPQGKPEKLPDGSRGFTLSDPDGYKLVFFEKKGN